MLSKNEKIVMEVIFLKCGSVGSCLITTQEIKSLLPKHKKITNEQIAAAVLSLELDDYFDVVYTEKNKNEMLCISLHSKGFSFKREKIKKKKEIIDKIILASLSAAVTFLVGRLLFFIFS